MCCVSATENPSSSPGAIYALFIFMLLLCEWVMKFIDLWHKHENIASAILLDILVWVRV